MLKIKDTIVGDENIGLTRNLQRKGLGRSEEARNGEARAGQLICAADRRTTLHQEDE